ncbi:MAG: pyridoxal-phosphate dependent enzyme [Pseudomonadota bacterium]
MLTIENIAAAAKRLAPHIRRTPLMVSEVLSETTGTTLAIKSEHQQVTGSFKIRGAINKVLGLPPDVAKHGIVAASSGNHGIATATAAALKAVPCQVYLPSKASPAKVAAIGRLGANIITIDSPDSGEAERIARAAAETTGAAYVSPYNDVDVITGQGTIAVEIAEDAPKAGLDHVDAVVVAVGGGGLISGIASWFKATSPSTVIVGASPANDQAMIASIAAGEIFTPESRETFSDGTAGGIEANAMTFDLCKSLVDVWITVAEDDIAIEVAAMIDNHHQLIEGAAGVALAAAKRYASDHPGASIAAVSCGANVSSIALSQMLQQVR